jgi:hypothetical protein
MALTVIPICLGVLCHSATHQTFLPSISSVLSPFFVCLRDLRVFVVRCELEENYAWTGPGRAVDWFDAEQD